MNHFWDGFEKRAEDRGESKPGYWARARGSVRAQADKNLGGVAGIKNTDLIASGAKRGIHHGLLGAAGGGALGALAGMASRSGARGGAGIGAALGGLLGANHGIYTADRDYLAKKGIKRKYLGLDHEFSPEAQAKYIDKYKKQK